MQLLICFCLLALQYVPHNCRSITIKDQEIDPNSNEVAEFLIPLLERSIDTPDHKTMADLRTEMKNPRKSWKGLKTNKKHLVEITPLRHKGITKPLAYIFSAAKHQKHRDYDAFSVTREDSNESFDSNEFVPKIHKKVEMRHENPVSDEEKLEFSQENHDDEITGVNDKLSVHSYSEHVPVKHHKELVNDDNLNVSNEAKDTVKENENVSDDHPFGPGDHVVYRKDSLETEETDSKEKIENVSHEVEHNNVPHEENVSAKVSNEILLSAQLNNDVSNEINIADVDTLSYTFGKDPKLVQEENQNLKDQNPSVNRIIKCQNRNGKSNEIGDDKDGGNDCKETEGEEESKVKNQHFRGAAKSYRLLFLFNK